MNPKTFQYLLLFSLFFTAQWFFGNLYEEIVIVPNLLHNTYNALIHFQHYFVVTNPVYYYVPFTLIGAVVTVALYFKTAEPRQKRLLARAAVVITLALLLSIAIITQINFRLFFGNVNSPTNNLLTLAVLWLIGNLVRLVLVGVALYYLFKAYITALDNSKI